MTFEFMTATQILFGVGSFQKIGSLAADIGRKALITSGFADDSQLFCKLMDLLRAADLEAVYFPVPGEPSVEMVQRSVEVAKRERCDLVIGFGGGSAIDAGKATAALATNPGDVLDYLEVIGRGMSLEVPPLAVIAAPTTAGTGAEATRNAVLASQEQRVKVSLRSPRMFPRLALVDPELTYSLPPEITASTGLDALTQLIEPFVCNIPNPLVDALCREGLQRAAGSLSTVYLNGDDHGARTNMCLASLFGGLALANARLGAVHGFAGVLGGMYPAPHGVICARLLPIVIETNIAALQAREADNLVLGKYDEIARLLTGDPTAHRQAGVAWIQRLCAGLKIPGLSNFGFRLDEIPLIVEKATQASSMKGNPIKLTPTEMTSILQRAQ